MIVLSANAGDADGSISKVDFYRGTILIGTATAPPYTVTWSNVAVGGYVLTAVATDNRGASTTSSPPVSISVISPTVLVISTPTGGTAVNISGGVAVSGTFEGSPNSSVIVADGNSSVVATTSGNTFAATVPAAIGTSTLTVQLSRPDNTSAIRSVTVTGYAPPVLVFTSPATNVFDAPANVTLAVDAKSPGATLTSVSFFNGNTLLASVPTPPYQVNWPNIPRGTYAITAKAQDSHGAEGTAAFTLAVNGPNTPPAISITSPAAGATFRTGGTVNIAVNAADNDGSIAIVDFMVDGAPFSSTNVAPYTGTWSNITVGSHNLTARATDNQGAQTTSAPVAITVTLNSLPTVSLTAPQAGAQYQPPATIAFAATAADSDGTVAKVEFLLNGAVVGSATAAPYAFTAINVAAGSYTAAARAIDNDGAATTSTGVTVTVAANQSPVVSITSPTSGASFTAPVDVTFTASASDSDGSVAKVELFAGTTLLRTLTAAPYTYVWKNPLPGTYLLTAKATDDRGAVTTSSGVPITVGGTAVQITAPADGASFPAPASFALQATAATTGANVTKLEFFDGSTRLSTFNVNAPSVPASLSIAGVAAGIHIYTVKATISTGAIVTSAPVTVNVLAAATIELSTLSNFYLAPATIDLNATVTAVTNTTIAKVEFFNGSNLIATVSSPPYSFRVSNTPTGNYTFTAKVTDSQAFTVASSPVSVAVGSGVSLTLASGLNGSSVNNDDSVQVTGTAQAPPNSAISVNGQLATITADGQFFANAVPLAVGTNTITATLTAPDGETATQSASVTRTVNGGLPPAGSEPTLIDFRVTVSPIEGIIVAGDTFPVTITIEGPANKAFASMTLSCAAPGAGSPVGLGTYGCGYTTPERYTIVVEAKDAMGAVIYSKSNTVLVRSAQQHIAGVKAVYVDMVDRLKAGNKVGALKLFFSHAQTKYGEIFTALGNNIAAAAGQLGEVAVITAGNEHAEMVVFRTVNGEQLSFLIYLLRGEDGIWRIESM